jgi:RecA/RadA recombinase
MALSTKERIARLQKMGLIKAESSEYDIVPTRVSELNELLPGGYPKGKMHVVYGKKSLGKTTTIIQAISDEMVKDKDHISLLIPSEVGEDLGYYEKLGMPISEGRVLVMERDQYILEEVLVDIENYLKDPESGECLVNSILIDSWDGFLGNKQLYTPDGKRKEATRGSVGAKAAGASEKLPLIKPLAGRNNVLFMVICQTRVQGLGGYMPKDGFSGGNALEHYADTVTALTSAGAIKKVVDGRTNIIGQSVRFTLEKSKVNDNAHQSVTSDYVFKEGWDKVGGAFTAAVSMGIIKKGGAGYHTYAGYPLAGKGKTADTKLHGADKSKDFFKDPVQLDILIRIIDQVQERDDLLTDEDLMQAEVRNIYSTFNLETAPQEETL